MRLIDADKLVENIEGITWYSANKDGVIHKGAANREESYYRGSEIWEAIEKAPTVYDQTEQMISLKKDRDHLLHIARTMHLWIFENTFDEGEVYRDCGLRDEDNARLGYGGEIRIGGTTNES